MDWFIEIFVIFLFLVLKGFFSGSEIAMVNCDKIKMRHLAKKGDRGAKLVVKLFNTPDQILGTTLAGTNIATVTVTTISTLMFIEIFGSMGDIISVLVMTPILLILGEIVPKSVYQQKADTLAPRIIFGLRFFTTLFHPLIFVFSRVARFATRLAGGSGQSDAFITRDEFRMLLEMSDSASNMDRGFDRDRIRRIVRFAETTVGESMVPVADVVGISEDASMSEAIQVIWRNGFNRLPVYRGSLVNVVGVLTLSSWDLMQPGLEDKSIRDTMHPALFISPTQTVDQVLPLLQKRSHDHFAVVVDEFGSTAGILSMEDILEEVVGEIDVGYDFDEYHPRRRSLLEKVEEEHYIANGRAPISLINEQLHLNLPVGEAHTLAGLLMSRLRAIPREGDSIVAEDFRFTVISASDRHANQVRIQRDS
ncbi:hemolysin family protein [Magnetofaba australis]|uniref:HlyC/CorC family transporter n=1 Tax=Magnetofaba australis IT-1 TaxID=1434232 RepID=A0A1Y2K1T9_9PROT|nr:hemolysin family protein [Magnetofaba australis]OSM02001.1 hypothetical protein MAIT1_02074 [Magnetofaba australis IT-1]